MIALHNLCEDEKEGVNPIWTADAAVLESNLPQPGVRAHKRPWQCSWSGDQGGTYGLFKCFPLRRPLF